MESYSNDTTDHDGVPQSKAHLYATAVVSFWSWIRSCVFTDRIQEQVTQYVKVPLGIIFLPILTIFKLVSSNLQVVLNFFWRILIKVYENMLRLYDSVEEPRAGGLIGQMFGLLFYSLMLYGLYNLVKIIKEHVTK